MQKWVYIRLTVQYPVYMSAESLFYFEITGFCDMMKMVYSSDMLSGHFQKNWRNII